MGTSLQSRWSGCLQRCRAGCYDKIRKERRSVFTPPPFPANYPPGRVGGKVQGVIRLHRVPFGNKHRERIRADQLFICRDVDILVRNHILNGAVLLHNGILHQHTVAHNSTFLIWQPRNSTLFSTVPSTTQPSASRLFLTLLPSR